MMAESEKMKEGLLEKVTLKDQEDIDTSLWLTSSLISSLGQHM